MEYFQIVYWHFYLSKAAEYFLKNCELWVGMLVLC